jgi:hypothetical protein
VIEYQVFHVPKDLSIALVSRPGHTVETAAIGAVVLDSWLRVEDKWYG